MGLQLKGSSMKKLIAILALIGLATSAFAQYGQYGQRDVQVDGHTKRDGTYVEPHHRSAPNNTQYDNYNSRGNTNPYNGQQRTRNPRY